MTIAAGGRDVFRAEVVEDSGGHLLAHRDGGDGGGGAAWARTAVGHLLGGVTRRRRRRGSPTPSRGRRLARAAPRGFVPKGFASRRAKRGSRPSSPAAAVSFLSASISDARGGHLLTQGGARRDVRERRAPTDLTVSPRWLTPTRAVRVDVDVAERRRLFAACVGVVILISAPLGSAGGSSRRWREDLRRAVAERGRRARRRGEAAQAVGLRHRQTFGLWLHSSSIASSSALATRTPPFSGTPPRSASTISISTSLSMSLTRCENLGEELRRGLLLVRDELVAPLARR